MDSRLPKPERGDVLREIIIRLPEWCAELAVGDCIYETVRDRVSLAVDLSRRNIFHRTGGPFGAAVFASESGRLLGIGVNLVELSGLSVAHAEMVAIMMAQSLVGQFDLGTSPHGPVELATSTEPCAMCLGAVAWAGLSRVTCGARGSDAEAIGFDEGDKPSDWVATLARRGVDVVRDVCRHEAVATLNSYRKGGGLIYNGRIRKDRCAV